MKLVKLTGISKILIDSCFLIFRPVKDTSGIFMAEINGKSLTIILKLGQDKLIFWLA